MDIYSHVLPSLPGGAADRMEQFLQWQSIGSKSCRMPSKPTYFLKKNGEVYRLMVNKSLNLR
jgi:hypothetical protein